MVKPSYRLRPEVGLFAVALLVLGGWSWSRATGVRSLASFGLGAAEPRSAEPSLPRIALDRLEREPPETDETQMRDPFRFGQAKPPSSAAGGATPAPPPSLAPPPVDAGPALPPPPPTLPPFGVKFVGAIEQKGGLKVAVLLSDERKEVLTGREGDTVANRLKIVKIGLESVDVQDVGSERVRRIPLKGN